MKYNNVIPATFIKRINRFSALCEINGKAELVHVKNTGRLKELFIEGSTVYLEDAQNPNRKTAYSLVCVKRADGLLINIDSTAPNKVVGEALQSGKLLFHGEKATLVKAESTHGNSRFDFYIETATHKGYMEVKGCTLEIDGTCLFPDAPTLRGEKHVHELTVLAKEGYQTAVVFVIQMDVIEGYFTPNTNMQPSFTQALQTAKETGVDILAFTCNVTPSELILDNNYPVLL